MQVKIQPRHHSPLTRCKRRVTWALKIASQIPRSGPRNWHDLMTNLLGELQEAQIDLALLTEIANEGRTKHGRR
jgi:hypothetical protein